MSEVELWPKSLNFTVSILSINARVLSMFTDNMRIFSDTSV